MRQLTALVLIMSGASAVIFGGMRLVSDPVASAEPPTTTPARATGQELVEREPLGAMASRQEVVSAPSAAPTADCSLRARQWLSTAEDAAAWIDSNAERIDPTDPAPGIRWRVGDGAGATVSRTNLYDGDAGIVLFLLNLHRVTGKDVYADRCKAGANGLLSSAVIRGTEYSWSDRYGTASRQVAYSSPGLYTGAAGIGWTLLQVHREFGGATYLAAARGAADWIIATTPIRSGVAKFERDHLDVISGAGGVALFFLDLHSQTHDERYVEFARACGAALLAGAPAGSSTNAGSGVGYLGFSHGVAGSGYALTRLYEATSEQRFLDGALAVGERIMARAESRSGGVAWPVYDAPSTRGRTITASGWCHGPVGTSRFLMRLSRIVASPETRERYATAAVAGAKFAASAGGRQEWDGGLWGTTLCCGSAGVGDLLTAPEFRTKDLADAVAMANRVVNDGKRPAPRAICWSNDPSCSPGTPCYATGMQTGTAGVATFLLNLYVAETGDRVRLVALPDRN